MPLADAVKRSINAEMTRQRVSQRELARRVGMTQTYMWRRLSTHPRADLEFTPTELEQIAAALGVHVGQFFLDSAVRAA